MRALMGSYTFSDGGAETYTYAIQSRLEECVVQDNASYRALIKKKFNGDPKRRRTQKRKDAVTGPLLEGARKAFSAFIRAYPAKAKAVWHILMRAVVIVIVVVLVVVVVVVVIFVVIVAFAFVIIVVVVVVIVVVNLLIVIVIVIVVVVVVDSNSGNAINSGEGDTRTSHNKEQTVSGKGEKQKS